jgi:hypothetical protein
VVVVDPDGVALFVVFDDDIGDGAVQGFEVLPGVVEECSGWELESRNM